MNREELIEIINEDIVDQAQFYDSQHLPMQLSWAMYNYGHNDDYQIIAFVDASQTHDGTIGLIFTETAVYFCFKNPDSFRYGDIVHLSLVWDSDHERFYAKIQTTMKTFVFKNNYLNLENLIKTLSDITNQKIDFVMDPYLKVAHFVPIILNDLENDVYEDLELTSLQQQQVQDIYHELEMAKQLTGLDYQDEMRALCRYCLDFFEQFGLESEEIDALNQSQAFFDQKDQQENDQLEGAKKWFDEMSESYRQGHTEMYDQLKSTMDHLGIDEEALKNMSPEEVDQYVKDMCKKFGISQSMFDKLKDRFGR